MKDRMKSKSLILTFGFLFVMSLIVAIDVPASAEPKPEGTVTIGMDRLYEEGFLPWIGALGQSYTWELVYDSLVYNNMNTWDPIPGLAERWETSEDGKSITLWLRKGVSWHDGWGEVTAEDVKYTYERIMKEGSMAAPAKQYRKKIKNIEIKDPYTLVIHLKNPEHLFWPLRYYETSVYLPIVCKKYIEKVGDDKAFKNPIGSGPYRLIEHKTGSYMKFEGVKKHWRIVPEFEYVVMKAVPEESTRVAMLKTREIDIGLVTAPSAAELEAAGIRAWAPPGGYIVYLTLGGMMNHQDKRYDKNYHWKDPWGDIKVREAMNIAIDRKAIVKALYKGFAEPTPTCWYIGIYFGGDVGRKAYPYDPKRAKQLLAEAGYPNGFSIDIISYAKSPGAELPQVCETIAGYWEAVGIKAKIVASDYGAWKPSILKGKTAGVAYVMRYGNKPELVSTMRSKHPGAYHVFQSEELNVLIHEIETERDMKKRKVIWKKISDYLYDNYTSIPIVLAKQIWGYNDKKVGEWPPSPAGYPLNFAYIPHAKPLKTPRLFTP